MHDKLLEVISKHRSVSLLALFCFLVLTHSAHSASPTSQPKKRGYGRKISSLPEAKPELRSDEGSDQIQGMNWNSDDIKIDFGTNGEATAIIHGSILTSDSVKMRVQGTKSQLKWIPPTEPGRKDFALKIALQGQLTRFVVQALTSSGVMESEKKILLIPNWDYFSSQNQRRHVLTVSLGPSLLNYSESFGTGGFKRTVLQTSLVAKAAYSFLLAPPRWDLGVSSFVTVLPLSSQATQTANPRQTLQFLGVNLRLGYTIPFIHEPWKLSILAGWYYTTTFGGNKELGYSNQMGPQAFPTLRRVLKSGDAIFLYLKYAPITDDGLLGFLGPNSREIAGGIGWVHPLGNGTPLSVSFDYSNLAIVIPTQVNTVDVGLVSTTASFQSTSYTFTVGAGF